MGILMQGIGASTAMRGAQVAAQGDIMAAKAASEADTYNAGVATTNAQIALQNSTWAAQAGEANIGIQGAKNRAGAGALLATQASSGVDVGSKSAVDVRASQAAVGMEDALTIRSNAAKQAYGYQTEAASDTAQAALSKQQAAYDIQAGNIRSKATVLGAQTQITSNFGNYLMNNSLIGDLGSSKKQSPIIWNS